MLAKALFQLVVGLSLDVGLLFFRAYILTILWGWFVVPLYNISPLTTTPTVGLLLVWRLLRGDSYPDTDDPFAEQVAKALAVGFIVPTIILAIGSIVRSLI
jgi:hypothetical protein